MTNPPDTRPDAPTAEEVRARVAEIPKWRHRIEVGHGVVTPGRENVKAELRRLKLPADLRGKTVLDVGCSDGFYSFACEQRGASVVAVDDESSLMAGGVNGFRVAHELRGSSVDYRTADVENLEEGDTDRFDIVLFLNVLYHIRNPMRALSELARVTKPGGLMVMKTYFGADIRRRVRGKMYNIDLDPRPKAFFFPTTELANDPTNWWAPNRAGVDALLSATGWDEIEHIATVGDRLYLHARRVTDVR